MLFRSHSKIDRILVDPKLSLQFTIVSLKALPNVVSDHTPLLLSCSNEPTPSKKFKMELFWMFNPEAAAIIRSTWEQGSIQGGHNTLNSYLHKCQQIHVQLRNWHCSNFSEIEKQLSCCNNTVLLFDQIEEHRQLASYERQFRILARERAYQLSCVIEARWHHRSRCRWLRVGDKIPDIFMPSLRQDFAGTRYLP